MKMKKFLAVILCLILMLSCVPVAASALGASDTITIYHTNDMHANVENLSYVAAIKENTPNSLLVDAGDAVQGDALATYTQGDAMIQMMNASHYDVATLGNHEFDYGSDVTLKNCKSANFPYISANTLSADKNLFLQGINGSNGAYEIQEVNGHKIGIFGITTTETAYKTNPQGLNGVTFTDEIETSKKMVEALQNENCDVIVALCHIGIDGSTVETSHILAEQVDGIDLIIDGHSHSEDETVINNTHICQTGTKLANLGEVTITFDENNKPVINSRLIPEEEYKTMAEPDTTVSDLYTQLNKELEPILNEKVAESSSKIFYSAEDSIRTVRCEQTPCSTLVADAMKWSAEQMLGSLGIDYPVVVLENGGGIRADLPEGTVTKGDILNVLPYGNTIQISEITPKQLYQTLENGIQYLSLTEDGYIDLTTSLAGAYPQIAGMLVLVDTDQAVGQRVTSVVLNGSGRLDPNDDTTKIAIASNDFELSGGDGYSILGELTHIAEGGPLDYALQEYVKSICDENGVFSRAAAETRVFIKSQTLQQYASPYLKVDLDLNLTANTEYTVCVDDTYDINVISDENGDITLAAAEPGYHTIYVDGGEYYYTSTISGINILSWAQALMGDADKDDVVTIMDATFIQKYLAKLSAADTEQIRLSDYNGDKKVNILDVTKIQMNLANYDNVTV